MWLTAADCKAVLQSLLSAELGAYRGATAPTWQDPPEIDSLERLFLAGCVNEFFCLHETGVEDRLLMTHHLDDWVALVADAITDTSGLTFRTSGSTGTPTSHRHGWQQMKAEAEALAQCLAAVMPVHRVVSWVPLHHLYGFMWGVALPAVAGIPRTFANGHALPELSPGDLLVTVPPRWDYLARSRHGWPAQVSGASSTAALSVATADTLRQQGMAGVLDVYGSTETGGVATRWWPDESYRLLSHWQRSGDRHIQRVADGATVPLMDDVLWVDESNFSIKGRLDGVVAIGGVNVSPAYVAERLRALASVADCAVRTTGEGPHVRLKAFVVSAGSDEQAGKDIAGAIAQWPAAERPVSIAYGDVLPVNAIGKAADW